MKIDPMYLIIALFLVQVVLFILLINVNMKYNRLKTAYTTFLKGKDGKNLEESFFEKKCKRHTKKLELSVMMHLTKWEEN